MRVIYKKMGGSLIKERFPLNDRLGNARLTGSSSSFEICLRCFDVLLEAASAVEPFL